MRSKSQSVLGLSAIAISAILLSVGSASAAPTLGEGFSVKAQDTKSGYFAVAGMPGKASNEGQPTDPGTCVNPTVPPATFLGVPNFKMTSASFTGSQAVTSEGKIYSWGYYDTVEAAPRPAILGKMTGFKSIDSHSFWAGSYTTHYAIAIKDDGSVGYYELNQSGGAEGELKVYDEHGKLWYEVFRAIPGLQGKNIVAVDAISQTGLSSTGAAYYFNGTDVVSLAGKHIVKISGDMALDDQGVLWRYTQTEASVYSGFDDSKLVDFHHLGSTWSYGAAVDANGHGWLWSLYPQQNPYGPTDITPSGVKFKQIAVGYSAQDKIRYVAIDTAGNVWQAGDLWNPSASNWKKVPGLSNIKQVAVGNDFAEAVDSNGKLWVWGYNNYGIYYNFNSLDPAGNRADLSDSESESAPAGIRGAYEAIPTGGTNGSDPCVSDDPNAGEEVVW